MESKSDQKADDPMLADNHAGLWTHLVDSLREEINNALRREHFRDASELQRMVLIILDNLNAGNLTVDVARNAILQEGCKQVGSYDTLAQNPIPSSCRQVSRSCNDREINDGSSNGNWKNAKGNAGNSPINAGLFSVSAAASFHVVIFCLS